MFHGRSREKTPAPYARLTTRRLTSDVCESNFAVPWGWVAVKRHCRSLVLFLMTGVLGGFAVPPVDLPETSYDESDVPINLAPPSQATFSSVRPVGDPLLMPGLPSCRAGCLASSLLLAVTAVPRQLHPHSLQDLLCTFLI
jgi:hypothetical protein